jgi:DNA (cytosine-5)-methyltransferase 1
MAIDTKAQPGSVQRDVTRPAELVLSLFPGIGLLDMAFEQEGFCLVRGPDLIWGGDVRKFHPPAGKFDGVIGGPPCKWWSSAANIAKARGQTVQPDMIPEFVRCLEEARPKWFLMENVRGAPVPAVKGYLVHDQLLDANACGADQRRVRRISFGTLTGAKLHLQLPCLTMEPRHMTVTTRNLKWDALRKRPRSNATISGLSDALSAQGLPSDFLADSPLRKAGLFEVVANGVPLPMGRCIAKAIRTGNHRI